jgi:hypothetical protein
MITDFSREKARENRKIDIPLGLFLCFEKMAVKNHNHLLLLINAILRTYS